MTPNREIVFVIRRQDLNRAIKEVRTNCKGFKEADSVHLLVSGYAMTIRAMGMESEYPVNGMQPGTFQMPIAVLQRIANMRKSKELELRIQDGSVSSGTCQVRHASIQLSAIPDLRVSVPIEAPVFDLVVIGRLLDDAELERQGLLTRVSNAREQMRKDVARATSCLSHYRVDESDIELLVERSLKLAEPSLRAAMYA